MQMEDQSLGEIARNTPGATRLFRQFGMDFCCGGERSLGEEAKLKGIKLEEVKSSLHSLISNPEDKNWAKSTSNELIAHILGYYHARYRMQLPELIRLAQKVERVHAQHEKAPLGLADHLADIFQELEDHMQKEEELFQKLNLEQDHVLTKISVMKREHLEYGEALKKIIALAHQLVLPEGACNTWRALYLNLGEWRDDLMEHIHLENNILFKMSIASQSTCCGSCG